MARLRFKSSLFCLSAILFGLILLGSVHEVKAQVQEPELIGYGEPKSPFSENLRNGMMFQISVNNFGAGVFGQYDRSFSPQLDGFLKFGFTGLRDVSEQTFTDYFFGQQVIPNKYQRGLAIPVMGGVRHRLFARQVQDNYRFYVGGSAGTVFAFTFPYFKDFNENGYRERFIDYFENTNDVFSGWKNGSWHVGLSGEATIGIDFGTNFAKISRLQFGYLFFYFPEALQMMMPNQPILVTNPGPDQYPYELNPDGSLKMQPFFGKQSYFGSPTITLSFGRMW